MSFGAKLKDYRRINGISQEDLAKKLNTTKQVISRYENEQRSPKLSVAVEYSAKLGIPIDVLVDDKKGLENSVSDDLLKFALFGGDTEITEEQLNEVKNFAKFIKERDKD